MAVSRVQSTAGSNTTGTTLDVTFVSNVTAGNVIVVAGQSGSPLVSVTDSLGNTYTQLQYNTTTPIGYYYFAENIAGGACTVTVTIDASNRKAFSIYELSGCPTSGADHGSELSTAAGTSVDSGSGVTTTVAACYGIAAAIKSNASTTTSSRLIGGGAEDGTHSAGRHDTWYKAMSGTGTWDATCTLSNSEPHHGIVGFFEPTTSTVPPTGSLALLGVGL